MRAALHITAKDLRLLLRDPQVLILTIAIPLVLAVVIGFAMEGVLSGEARLKVAAVDLDRTAQSASFMEDLDARDAIVLDVRRWDEAQFTEDDAASLLDDGKRLAVLVVPEGFAESAGGGPQSEVLLYTDPAQRQFVNSVTALVGGELQRGSLTEAAVAVGAQGGLDRQEVLAAFSEALASPVVSVREEALLAGTSLPSGFDQTVPGFTIMFSLFLANFIVIMVYRERAEYGTWRRVLLSPTSRAAVLGGQALSAYAIGALQMVVLFTLGRLAFGMELANVPGLIVAVGIFLLIPVGLGLFFAPSENYMLTNSLLNLAVILLGAIGGALVPIFLLPGWMEALASFTPHYWALQAVQDLLFRGAGLADITINLAVLLGFAAVLWAGALVRLRSAP